jgi:predicted nucleic acid-binding protein
VILADTSIWIDHLRSHNALFARLLADAQILVHPYVIGELAVGNIKERRRLLLDLSDQPQAPAAHDNEVLTLIERNELLGKGIGYIDVHLLASARLCKAKLWTTDKRLHAIAVGLGLSNAY